MKSNFRQNEILILTNTSFSSRDWAELNKPEKNSFSEKEKLMEACWNGLLPELLPECFDFMFNKSMLLWGVSEADTFIDLEYGNSAPIIDKECSVNPYIFLQAQPFN